MAFYFTLSCLRSCVLLGCNCMYVYLATNTCCTYGHLRRRGGSSEHSTRNRYVVTVNDLFIGVQWGKDVIYPMADVQPFKG